MLDGVHGKTGGQHQNEDDEHRGEQLLALADNDVGDDVHRVVVGVDAEKAQDSCHTDQAERHRSRREEHRQIIRQEGHQVNDTGTGQRIPHVRTRTVLVRVQAWRRIHSKHIVQREKSDGNGLDMMEKHAVFCGIVVKGSGERPNEVQKEQTGADRVIALVDSVIHHADRNHLEHSLAQAC